MVFTYSIQFFCTFITPQPVPCPALSSPANGTVIVSWYSEGGVAIFVCDEGYELSMNVTLTCQPNGTWTGGV